MLECTPSGDKEIARFFYGVITMSFENISAASPADSGVAAIAATGDNSASALNRLQLDAGLQDRSIAKPSDSLAVSADKALNTFSLNDIQSAVTSNDFQFFTRALTPPTDQQRAEAEKALESRMSKLIPQGDRAAMQAITTALLNGDQKALADAIKIASKDPKKLQALLVEVDKIMEEKGCSTRLDLTSDGKVLVSSSANSTALALDPASGRFEAKAVEHMFDGSVRVEPGELLHVDKNKVFKDMADSAVRAITGTTGGGDSSFNPFLPGGINPSPDSPPHPRPHPSPSDSGRPPSGQTDHTQPSSQQPERPDAGDDGPSELIPQAERVSIFAIFAGLANGDARAFADALKKAGGDPEKLQELLDEVNKMLKKQNSSTRLDLSADGKVIISDTNSGTALSVDPATGKVEARAVEHKDDGAILVKPGEVVHVDINKLFKDMGASLTVPAGK